MFSESSVHVLLFGFCLAATLLYLRNRFQSQRQLPLPPGPPSSWIGSVQLPQKYPWRGYAQWRHIYGDLVYVRILGNPICILNSSEVISDLLEKRSANFSSRPVRTMVGELMGWNWLVSSMPYGPSWKIHRSLFVKHFPVHSSSKHPLQLTEVHTLLRALMKSPHSFLHHVRTSATSLIVRIIYAIDLQETMDDSGDNFVTLADTATSSLSHAGIFGTYLVDYIPILKYTPAWLPGASFKRKAAIWRNISLQLVNRPFDVVQRRMLDGNSKPCVVAQELDDIALGQSRVNETVIRNMAATTYAAGADTVVSALQSLFLAVVLHPHVQERAQRELDAVIGNRLPLFSDRPQLPYIDCICYELLRWNPVTPLGLARYVTEDDEYRGYRIPKGTTIIPNVWAVLHDPAVYPDPLAFNPDRFEKNIDGASPLNAIPDAAFGFGRRMCPGRWFAFDFLWIAVASILSTYRISNAFDGNGEPIVPSELYGSSLLSHPEPFECSITPRSSDAKKLIEETALNDS
ncbi:cytochrome P450, partial [Hymenopellis radicata]